MIETCRLKNVVIFIQTILNFLLSRKIMASSSSNLINNLSWGIHRIKCKFGHDDKKCETCGISFLEYTNFKYDLIEYKCLCFNKDFQHKFKVYKFFNHNSNKFILLLRKGVYPYDMDDWGKFNKTLFPEKEDFYGHVKYSWQDYDKNKEPSYI